MARLDPSQQSLFDALTKAWGRGPGDSGQGGGSASIGVTEFVKAVKNSKDKLEKLSTSIEKLLVENGDQEDAVEKATAVLIKSTQSFGDLDAEVRELLGKSLPQARAYIESVSRASKDLTTGLGKTIRNQSLFGAALLESHAEVQRGTLAYSNMLGNMYDAANGLSEGLLRQANLWDENSNSIRKNLDPQDFARLHVAIGQAQTAVVENLGGIEGMGKLSALSALSQEQFINTTSANSEAGKKLQSQLIAAALQLEALGQHLEIPGVGGATEKVTLTQHGQVNQAAIDALQGDAGKLQALTQALLKNVAENNAASRKFAEIAKNSSTLVGGLLSHITSIGSHLTGLEVAAEFAKRGLFLLGDTATIKKSFDLMKEGVMGAVKQIADFNNAGVPASFKNVTLESFKLGMSFSETVEFMQQNKRQIALFGGSFDSLTDNYKATFQKFGITMKQGAEVVGPAFEAAIATGINVKSGDQVNKFTDSLLSSFSDLRGAVNVTAGEYAKQTAALIASSEVQGNILGLDKEASIQRVKDIFQQQKYYVSQGLSLEAANDLIKAQNAQKNEAVKDQLANAAKLALGAQIAGLNGQQVAQIQRLYLKGAARTKEENVQFDKLKQQRAAGLAGRTARANATGDIGTILGTQVGNQFVENLTGSAAAGQQAANTEAASAKAGNQLTDDQLAQAAAAAKGSESIAGLGNVANTLTSVFSNPLTKSIFGATGGLIGLALQSLLTARSLGQIGGSFGNLGGLFKKLFGGGAATAAVEGAEKVVESSGAKAAEKVAEKGGLKVAEKIGAKTIGKSLLKAIPGIGLIAALGFGAQRAFGGDFKGAGLEVASGAASLIPGVGTAASLAIDAGIAGRDFVNASEAAGKPPIPGQPGAGETAVNTTGTTGEASPTDKSWVVQDPTSHDYLSAIADSMIQAVKLLQMISDNGNPEASNVVVERLKAGGVKNIPTATSYTTGRQMAAA